jgi:geranylgeranyl pyrophosphate synthase
MTSTVPHIPPAVATSWYEEARDDLNHVENKMRQVSHMGHDTLDAAVDAIITAGGKRLRPAITLLTGRLFGAAWSAIIAVAASIELLHTATLVHDDLIDGADERRGAPTLHSRLPIGITVLTGDFLFAQAAALAAEANDVEVVKLFSETLVKICRGEILQAQTRWHIPDMAIYEERIYGKTAALFEAAAVSAAMLADAGEDAMTAMARYGRRLGLAFQIVDDALDFVGTTQQLGKPAGHDMRQGIFNLPIMFYVADGYMSAADFIRRVENEDKLDDLVADIRGAQMVEKSLEVARLHVLKAAEALDHTPGGKYANHLNNITEYALARAY